LLSATQVLGRPESYFREPDELTWARRFGLGTEGQRVQDCQRFAKAVRDAATTSNGTFGARIMWRAVARIRRGLEVDPSQSDLGALEAAFGPLHFVHLQRSDVIGQAVSWARAEQKVSWQAGDRTLGTPEPDIARICPPARCADAG
jgi:LPS sulfotransferase NodH